MWFLKRAPQLSLEEFHDWWLNHHVPAVARDQSPYLARYVVNLSMDAAHLPSNRTSQDLDWDGVGVQYFRTEEDYRAVYGRTDRPTTGDTMAHISSMRRLVVREHVIDLARAGAV